MSWLRRLFPPPQPKRWHVKVIPINQGTKARVMIFPKRNQHHSWDGVGVCDIAFSDPKAEEQLEAAKEKAAALAQRLRELERERV